MVLNVVLGDPKLQVFEENIFCFHFPGGFQVAFSWEFVG